MTDHISGQTPFVEAPSKELFPDLEPVTPHVASAQISPPAVVSPNVAGGDPVLAMIERAARDPAIDVVKLEQLFALHERREDKEAVKAFNRALSRAKNEIGPIYKRNVVSYGQGKTSYKHETLDEIMRMVDPVFANHGLSYRFRSEQPERDRVRVICVVSHEDGHFEEVPLESAVDTSGSKNAIQAIGSAVTYLQRYTLKLAAGLSASNDDDGRGGPDKTPVDDVNSSLVTPKEIAEIRRHIAEAGSDEAAVLKWAGFPTVESLTFGKAKEVVAFLEQKKRVQRNGR